MLDMTEPSEPEPEPGCGAIPIPRWEVVATRPDYSLRAPLGRFASLDEAEAFVERLRAQGYRDIQVEPLPVESD
jgi:hypothetical protein